MTQRPLSVSVKDVDVKYKVFEERTLAARDFLRRGLRPRKASEVHAVKGVTFDVKRGEAVGIIGANGSGKSTLLRVIAGLQPIASGQVLVAGRASLLSVGAALKPQLTGLRNVMLGGLAMGLTVDEVENELGGVLEFAQIGDAIHRPLNTYSSGMRARLAFSIATLRIPDVLLIDEALAVGDASFRERSLARINQIREEASSVVMVTHSFSEVRATCSRAIWIEDGAIAGVGEVDDIIERYEAASRARD